MDTTSTPRFETFWDRAYRDGDHLHHWEPTAPPPELVALVDSLPIGAGFTVLDLGCGTALELVYLARRIDPRKQQKAADRRSGWHHAENPGEAPGPRLIGVDSSHRAIELAQERARRARVTLELHRSSIHRLPLADTSVDLILDRGCLHCIEPEDRPSYASEVTRVLRSDGTYFVRGARDDDEEAGLFGLDAARLSTLFPPGRFVHGPVVPFSMDAPASTLPAVHCRIEHRGVPPTSAEDTGS